MVPRQLVIRLSVILIALATSSNAQERLTPDAFLSLMAGKTAEFRNWRGNRLVGTEHFFSTELSAWRRDGGACVYGRITIELDAVCFTYPKPEAPSKACWWPVRTKDGIFVIAADFRRTDRQRVVFTDTDVGCEDPLLG